MDEVSKSRQQMVEERIEITTKNDDLQAKHDAIEETLADMENDAHHKSKEITQWFQKLYIL